MILPSLVFPGEVDNQGSNLPGPERQSVPDPGSGHLFVVEASPIAQPSREPGVNAMKPFFSSSLTLRHNLRVFVQGKLSQGES